MSQPVRLAIEAVGTKHSGGATVLLDFLDDVEQDSRIGSVFLFCSEPKLRLFSLERYSKVKEIGVPHAESAIGRLLWMNFGLSRAVAALQPDVLLCFNCVGKGPAGVPKACFVQQSLPFSREALRVSRLRDRVRCSVIRRMMQRSLSTGGSVFVQTPTMRSWIIEAFGISPDRMTVVIPSVSEFQVSDDSVYPLAMAATPPDRRLLYVGNASNYKNVNCAIAGMNRVRQTLPGAVLFVTWPADHPACRVEGIAGLGYLTGTVLPAAYKAASAFVLPSLVESGNVTMMEAMSVGTPVLAADRPYAHDLCGDAAQFFDPIDPGAFASAAIEVLTNERLRNLLSRKGIELIRRRQDNRPYRIFLDHICKLTRSKATHRSSVAVS